jgi:hypothetical protein
MRLLVLLALALLATLAALPACVCTRGLPAQAGTDFGDVGAAGALEAAQADGYLALARSIVEGRSPSDMGARGLHRRVMLAAFRPGTEEPLVATAIGPTQADSVAAAAKALASKSGAAAGRLEIDVPTSIEGADLEGSLETPAHDIGLKGILVTRDDGRTGVVLPSEIAERGLFQQGKTSHLDRDRITQLLAVRAGVGPEELPSMRAYLFRVTAYVEAAAAPGGSASNSSPSPRPPPMRLMRGIVEHPSAATPEPLLAAVRLGADYIVRVLNAEGRYVYLYHPLGDRDDTQYGWLRHAGTTYALLEAYEEFGTPLYLEKAELALRYLTAHLHDDPGSQGKYALDAHDEEQQKVGGAGLALLAFAKHAAVTGKRDQLDTMRALARFITKQQYEDGHFRSNVDLEHESGKKLKRDALYYPGEAALALLRLYAVDPQPAYLDTARRAADWVVRVRDAYVSEDNQEHDHWMSYTFNDLYRLTHDGAYLEHAYKIARAIQRRQQRADDAPAPDWVGTFYEGATTPAATRVEAYDADIALSRFAGKPEAWLLGPAQEVACSMLGQQFRPDNDYWLKNPTKAEGGVRESLLVQDVRIDYVQHAMSAWLHLARILRDPSYGKTGVPSQDPVR